MKKKNALVVTLIVIALVLWSHNIYQVFFGLLRQDEKSDHSFTFDNRNVQSSLQELETPSHTFQYQANFRDPFQHYLPQTRRLSPKKTSRKTKITRKTIVTHPPPPVLIFTGIIRDSVDVMAIIQDSAGNTNFVTVGDTILEIEILEIANKTITCQFYQKSYTIQLQ